MIISPAKKLEHINEYYFSRKLKQIAQLIAEGKPIINLGIGNPDQAPSPATIDALVHAAQNPKNHGYQSYIGIPELRKAMSKWYQHTYAVSLDAATEILPLLGSKEGISHISNAFLNPGDKVLVPNPGYPTYSSATYLAGAIPVAYDLDETNNWAPDFTKISEERGGENEQDQGESAEPSRCRGPGAPPGPPGSRPRPAPAASPCRAPGALSPSAGTAGRPRASARAGHSSGSTAPRLPYARSGSPRSAGTPAGGRTAGTEGTSRSRGG